MECLAIHGERNDEPSDSEHPVVFSSQFMGSETHSKGGC